MNCSYLRTFFEEKGLDEQVYQVEAKGGTTNWICTADVIDALLNASDNIHKVKENTIKNNKGDLSADVNSSDDE